MKGFPSKQKLVCLCRGNMKTLVTLVLLTLICFLQHSSAGPVGPNELFQENCCPNYTQKAIPKGRVTHVVMTPSTCKAKAIVVTTVCGNKFCINANWTWAKNLLKEFQKATANKTSPSAPFKLLKC